jgi:hypothetical protein
MTTFIRAIWSAVLMNEWELAAEVDWDYRMSWHRRLPQEGFKDERRGFSVSQSFFSIAFFGFRDSCGGFAGDLQGFSALNESVM